MSVSLRSEYLGLELRSPLVASASPITGDPDICARIEEAGAGAIVLPSLFEEEILTEEIELNRALEQGTEHFAEALDYFPAVQSFAGAGDRYLAGLERIKRRVSVPVIASLNGTTDAGWVQYARHMEAAGADALELNLYHVVANPKLSAADVEQADLALIASVRAAIGIPLAVKLSPYYSALAGFAGRAVEAGADGLVLFNRFYQPDLDLETLDVAPRVELSRPWELRLPLRWIAMLRPQLGSGVSLAATSGVHSGDDVVKALAVGADVAMLTSALLRDGPGHLRVVEHQLSAWLAEREYESVAQLRGSASQATARNPSAFERANYVRTLRSWSWPAELEPGTPLGATISVTQPTGRPEG